MRGIKAYFLIGPTAVGKSAVAQEIACRQGYDIVSADSMLIYSGMDIGTAKPTAAERGAANYWCLDLVSPDRSFSVWDYRQYAIEGLTRVAQAGREAIVVGGTGLYIKSLVDGLSPGTAPDAALREKWEKVIALDGLAPLRDELLSINAELYESIKDKDNPRRLIRALEIALAGGEHAMERQQKEMKPIIGLKMPAEILERRIVARVEKMYEQGLLAEVKTLLLQGFENAPTARQAIGYAEAVDLIHERCSVADAMKRTITRTRQLAKRQLTWFKHQANVKWITCEESTSLSNIATKVMDEWRQLGPTSVAESECS